MATGASGLDIAVTGLGVRLPGADDIEQYWDNLVAAKEFLSIVSDRRRVLAGADEWTDVIGELAAIDCFDHEIFGISKETAALMDPQQRKILETAFNCCEEAAVAVHHMGPRNIGVYIGASGNTYAEIVSRAIDRSGAAKVPPTALAGSLLNMSAANVSRFFNFCGPSLVLDSACSSFLYACHYAIQTIESGAIEGAVVGASYIMATPSFINLAKHAGVVSSTGSGQALNRTSDGAQVGEGVVCAFIEPLQSAVTRRKHIYGVIRSISVINDGQSFGALVPNPAAQQKAIEKAQTAAKIGMGDLQYLELHCTGSNVGDSVELRVLDRLRKDSAVAGPLAVGSVKNSIGHLMSAAGGAAMAKVLLMLSRGALVPTVNATPTAAREYGTSALRVITELEPWHPPQSTRRLAGVSCFGAGGTNAHCVISEAPARPESPESPDMVPSSGWIAAFSARTPSALQRLAQSTSIWLSRNPQARPIDVCRTRNLARHHFKERFAVVFNDTAELAEKLGVLVSMNARQSFPSRRPPRHAIIVRSSATRGILSIDYAIQALLREHDVSIKDVWIDQACPPSHQESVRLTPERDPLMDLSGEEAVTLAKDAAVLVFGTCPTAEALAFPQIHLMAPEWAGAARLIALNAVAALYELGMSVKFGPPHVEEHGRIIPMPGYSFDAISCWADTGNTSD